MEEEEDEKEPRTALSVLVLSAVNMKVDIRTFL